ncbi:MAG: RdgB/HAM1 family non-canonical purine NTP pyrophosphatase [Ruminococcaceae bacterium]|jgi:XTP/dITP diphosphohydrolase|nr:RdgB/HAM1 family non-canonical purine NTP pyrophosphatase [Oscillospiraceae bacterium]
MKFVLATQNPKKKEEMVAILGDLGVDIVTEEELGIHVEVEETGKTFGENAALKAKAVMEATGLPAIGDDSGLCVDALKGAPGVYSARYGGPDMDDYGRCKLILDGLKGETDRRAHFETYIVCAFPNGDWFAAKGECQGSIAFAAMGNNGFGYDPIFFRTEEQKTFAQMTAAEKAAISHRGNALRSFKTKLEKYLAEHPEG